MLAVLGGALGAWQRLGIRGADRRGVAAAGARHDVVDRRRAALGAGVGVIFRRVSGVARREARPGRRDEGRLMRPLRSVFRVGDQFRENVGTAIDSLAAAKVRSGLTVLGVVIGVSTVMAMATIVSGVRDQIVSTIEIAGPTTFYVMKAWSQTPVNPQDLPAWIRNRPDLIRPTPTSSRSSPRSSTPRSGGRSRTRLEYAGEHTNVGVVMGADEGYPEIYGGELADGRWFTNSEQVSGAAVAVLSGRRREKAVRQHSTDSTSSCASAGGRSA